MNIVHFTELIVGKLLVIGQTLQPLLSTCIILVKIDYAIHNKSFWMNILHNSFSHSRNICQVSPYYVQSIVLFTVIEEWMK